MGRPPAHTSPSAPFQGLYVLLVPLRYTDPSGHFTEEAIQGYLERKYGDRWSYYWQILEDIGLLSLLRAAQAGDILVHITLDRGKRGLATGYYAFEGSSDTLLFALRTADGFHHNPTLGAEAGLLDALPGLGQGLALFRFSADGQITAQAEYGKGAFASAGVIPPQQDYFWSAVRWGAKLLIKKICPLPVCDAANAADSIFNPTKNLWPRAGDVEVSYGIWHNESRSDKVIRGTYGINFYRFRDGLCVDFNTLYLDNVYGHSPW